MTVELCWSAENDRLKDQEEVQTCQITTLLFSWLLLGCSFLGLLDTTEDVSCQCAILPGFFAVSKRWLRYRARHLG